MSRQPALFDPPVTRPVFMLDTGLVAIADHPPELHRYGLAAHHAAASAVARTLEAGGSDAEAWRLFVDTTTGNEATRALEVARSVFGRKLRRQDSR